MRTDEVRALIAAAGRWRVALAWRTWRGRDAAVSHLESLKVALRALGWPCLALYDSTEFGLAVPYLWVTGGGVEEFGAVVRVRAVPGGWGYFEVAGGDRGLLAVCGDAEAAAARVDRILTDWLFAGMSW